MSMYPLLADMPSNLHLLTAGWRFIHAIWRQPAAGDSPDYHTAAPCETLLRGLLAHLSASAPAMDSNETGARVAQ